MLLYRARAVLILGWATAMAEKRMAFCGTFLHGRTCRPPDDIDARKLSWCWPIARQGAHHAIKLAQ